MISSIRFLPPVMASVYNKTRVSAFVLSFKKTSKFSYSNLDTMTCGVVDSKSRKAERRKRQFFE